MKKTKKIAAFLAVVIGVSLLTLTARADQPRMQAAKSDLNNAMSYLKKASADKGGHRERAMNLVSQAITAVDEGIEYDRTHFTPGGRRGRRNSDFDANNFVAASSFADQPNMEKARGYLNGALGNLNAASADKGGYRERAMRLAREAIAEVNAGIEFDRTH